MLPSNVLVEGGSMSLWVFVAVILVTLLVGVALGVFSQTAMGRSADGKPWWYDVAFPSPDEATLGAMKVLADRYALGEIDAEEYRQRAAALRELSETPEQRKQRMDRQDRAKPAV